MTVQRLIFPGIEALHLDDTLLWTRATIAFVPTLSDVIIKRLALIRQNGKTSISYSKNEVFLFSDLKVLIVDNLWWPTYLSWAWAENKARTRSRCLSFWGKIGATYFLFSGLPFSEHPTPIPCYRKTLNGWYRHSVRWWGVRFRFSSRSGESIRTLHVVRVCCALIYPSSPPRPDGGRFSCILAILVTLRAVTEISNLKIHCSLRFRRCALE
jgi:hypothetical protein